MLKQKNGSHGKLNRCGERRRFRNRPSRNPTPGDVLAKAMKRAREAKADIVLLVGDIISFPTLANIDHLRAELDRCGLPWLYVAGNHDWHFEGDSGSDIEQRARWAEKLMPSTYAFREAVIDTPNLVGVFTGHKHKLMVGRSGDALFFSVPWNRDGSCMDVRLSPLS